MKQQIPETIPQNSTPEKKYESFDLDYFYSEYEKEYKRPVSKSLFLKIIKTYMKVYFGELYAFKKEMYFFLGGKIKLVLSNNYVWNNQLKKSTVM